MAAVIAGMTMSRDGFVADPNGGVARLYSDMDVLKGSETMNAAIEATGAVLMGRKTFQMGDPDSYVGNNEFQVPIFVLTHHPPRTPPKQDGRLTFTVVANGVAAALAQAKFAAGEKAVQLVGGASVIQQLLGEGLVDELHADVMPVLLGGGLRLFEHLDPDRVHLEAIDVQTAGPRTSLTHRVVR